MHRIRLTVHWFNRAGFFFVIRGYCKLYLLELDRTVILSNVELTGRSGDSRGGHVERHVRQHPNLVILTIARMHQMLPPVHIEAEWQLAAKKLRAQ